MIKANHSISRQLSFWAASLLAFAFMLTQSDKALAQTCTCPWVTNGNNINTTNTGNVGIGTTTPGSKLEVIGNIALSDHSRITAKSDFSNYLMPYTNFGRMAFGTQGVDRMSILYNGNVGIGTNAPLGPLSVGDSAVTNSDGYLVLGKNNGGGGARHFRIGFDSAFNFVIGDYGHSNTAGSWLSPFAISWQAPSNSLYINSAGSIGIGTNSPAFLLDVVGSTNTPFRVRDSSGREYISTTTRTGPFATVPVVSLAGNRLIIDNSGPDGNNDTILRRLVNHLIINPSDHPTLPGGFMVRQQSGASILFVDQATNGKVGIGTTSPGYQLDVQGGQINASGGLCINGDCRTTWPTGGGPSQWTTSGTNIYYNSGNVGIGTTTPSTKLHVVGDVTVTGNIAAKYQDIAEWVSARSAIPVGAVVVLDTEKSNQVVASQRAYDTRVAGVISNSPGVILGEGGKGKVMVATTGRVRVKVDATRAPIRVGDLLVTSDKEGIAMRSEPLNLDGTPIHRPGTLIGKALEPLNKGVGEILVLLSLQ